MSENTTLEPFKVSWSALQNWELCKQKGWLVSQRKSSAVKDSRNFFHGTVVDRIMRNWLQDPVAGKMPLMVDDYMDSTESESQENGDGFVKWRHKEDRKQVRDYCVELTTRLEPILLEKVVPYDYEPAKRFKIPITLPDENNNKLPVLLTGEFDLLVRDNDMKFHVWDLKATADNNYWKKTLGQLVFYDLAVYAMMGETPQTSGLIQPMCDEQTLEFVFTDADRRAMFSRIMAMMRAVWSGDHAPSKDSAPCYGCPVKASCVKYNKPALI